MYNHSFLPYRYLNRAKQWQKNAMLRIIAEENQFRIDDFHPEYSYEIEPEHRELCRNSSGWAVKVTNIEPDNDILIYYENFVVCKECKEVNLLSGGCSFCTDCGRLLEDDN